jgi:hypothetical protein
MEPGTPYIFQKHEQGFDIGQFTHLMRLYYNTVCLFSQQMKVKGGKDVGRGWT